MACLTNLLVPDLLSGTAVMNGSAKGTSLVSLVVAVPLLAVYSWRAHLGSTHALMVTTGATAYLLYNSVLFLFATPFNQAFLLYVSMLGLSAATLVGASLALWNRVDELATNVPWWVPAYVWLVVALNTTAWLSRVIPAMLADDPTAWLAGTGLTTNPVIAQDLALWLPLMAWLGWGVWRARPALVALAAAGLVFWVVESLGIAVDQWWGHQADPSSTWASSGAVPIFVMLALVGLLPTIRLFHSVPDLEAEQREGDAMTTRPHDRSSWPRRWLLFLAVLNTVTALFGAWGLVSGALDLGHVTGRLPWDSAAVAGVALGLLVAVPNAALVVVALRRGRYTGLVGIAVGTAMVAWIVVELAFIRELSFFHPLYVAIGLLMVWAGFRVVRVDPGVPAGSSAEEHGLVRLGRDV